jgi:carbonic anhydrase/acetyltransferase-like protein (isoleucine patch superfamily)
MNVWHVLAAVTRHREVMSLQAKMPKVSKGCFVAPSATVSGDVALGGNTAVWYGAIVR